MRSYLDLFPEWTFIEATPTPCLHATDPPKAVFDDRQDIIIHLTQRA